MRTNLEGPNPEELLQQALGGDADALAALLGVYQNYLLLLARIQIDKHLQAKADASDLVQETLLFACRDFAKFRGNTEAQFMQWLRTILANNGVKLARRYKNTKTRDIHLERRFQDQLDQSSMAIGQTLVSAESSPSIRALRREAAAVLADALAELPDDYREAMVLHHLEGLTIKEVARRMDRSLDSVKKLLPRAFVKLHGIMQDYF